MLYDLCPALRLFWRRWSVYRWDCSGSGGSIITLPVLVYVAHIPVQQAAGMPLVIVGGTSALGLLLNLGQPPRLAGNCVTQT